MLEYIGENESAAADSGTVLANVTACFSRIWRMPFHTAKTSRLALDDGVRVL